jgi:AraC-like DNA-binding protein/ribosomal protein S18 acetylase RimI-like enzyme
MNVDELLNYVNDNLKENLSLVDMASMVNYSPRQLYYLLKEITEMPIMSYIRHKKLLAAASEVANGRRMFDVAMDYGFNTQAGFYKAFFQIIGCSPSDYKLHEFRGNAHENIPILNQICMEGNFMEKVIIRKVRQEDTKSIWENIFSRNTPNEVEERIADSVMQMKSGNRVHLVAVIDENIVGNMMFVKEKHVLYSHRCIIYDAVVNPAFQRLGIASKLFEECCKYANELKFKYVVTTCRGNGTENFYKKIGMKECGRIPNGIFEPWGESLKYDEVILYKEL